jgi:hypothetical protein
MESVVVTEVSKDTTKGGKTIYTVEFEDGREAVTFDDAIAEEAFKTRGNDVEAEINVVKSGKFTNTYLNQLNGVGESRREQSSGGARNGSSVPSRGKRQQSGGGGFRDAATQERIARQWAYGRAVELAMASDITLPLTDEDKSILSEFADWLLERTS